MQLPANTASLADSLSKLPQQKIAKAVSFLLVAYVAYLIAQITWLALTPEVTQPNSTVISKSSGRESGSQSEQLSIQELQSLNLFGQYNDKPVEKAVAAVKDAPETRLKLTLSATVASDDVSVAAAIIENSGKQETYGVGDKITNTRATLEKVMMDRVIIKQLGRLETLMLDGFAYGDQPVKPAINKPRKAPTRASVSPKSLLSSNVVDQRNNKLISAQAKKLKQDLLTNPGKITDYLKISPKRANGRIVGYQLRPGKNPDFFHQSGLKLGDVAIQMNGYDLTEPSEAAQALNALRTEKDVSLQVSRNDEVTEILFSIDN